MQILVPRWLIPVEPSETVLEGHALLVDGERIAAIGPAEALAAAHPAAQRVELDRHALLPGLVNLHTHAAMALLRGVGDDLPLGRWLAERIWPAEGSLMSDAFVYDGSVLSCLEMLRGGVTCFNDMYFFPEAVARAALDTGMRAVLSIAVLEFPTPYAASADEYLRKGLAARDRYRDAPRLRFSMAPHAPYTVSDDTFREVAKLAAELSLPIHVHVHETEHEVRESMERHGMRPLARLAGLGVIGPDTIAVHAVHLSEHDLDLLARHRASVAHCPHSNLKLASGIAPVGRMLARGINVGIGTDGSASNNRLDLIAEARTASLLAKGAAGDAAAWPAHAVLEAMTLGGARAIGMDAEIGSLDIGKQADLVAIDLSAPELTPVYDPVSHLVYAAGREHVTDVWIAGEPVVRNRQLARERLAAAAAEVTARTGVWQNRVVGRVSGKP